MIDPEQTVIERNTFAGVDTCTALRTREQLVHRANFDKTRSNHKTRRIRINSNGQRCAA
jgi:hypothetical protein